MPRRRDISPRGQHWVLDRSSGLLCEGRMLIEQRYSHVLLLRMLILGRTRYPRYTHWVLEDHPLNVALANALGSETIATCRLLFSTFDTSFPTGYMHSISSMRSREESAVVAVAYSSSQSWFASSEVCEVLNCSRRSSPQSGHHRWRAPLPTNLAARGGSLS